ncbi:MAG: hypothetical protein ACK5MT_19715 [Actinomycetales bacterium]
MTRPKQPARVWQTLLDAPRIARFGRAGKSLGWIRPGWISPG